MTADAIRADHAHPEPLRHFALRDDPLTTLAADVLTVGTRSLLALSDGFFSLENIPAFLGSPGRPHAFYDDQLAAGVAPPRMPVGAFVWPGEPNVLINARLRAARRGRRVPQSAASFPASCVASGSASTTSG